MNPEVIPGLSALCAWLLGELLRRRAAAAGWSAREKRRIPRLAVLVGAGVGCALGVLLNGGGWREVALGALGGAAAVALRETTRPAP